MTELALPNVLLKAHALASRRCKELAAEGFDCYQMEVNTKLETHFCVDGCAYRRASR